MLSLIISSLVIQLSIPAFAPARRIDYIEHLPLTPVADVSMDYGDVIIRSITGSGFGGSIQEGGQRSIVIDCIGYGIVSITNAEGSVTAPFFQRISLNVLISDIVVIGEPIEVAGRSNLTILAPEGRTTFKGILDGTIIPTTNFIDAISFLMNLQYRAGSTQEYAGEPTALVGASEGDSSNRLFLSLNIEGLLSNQSDVTASGQLLSLRRI